MKKNNLLTRVITGAVLTAVVVGFFFLRNVNVSLFSVLSAFTLIVGTGECAYAFYIKAVKEDGTVEVKATSLTTILFDLTVLSAALLAPAYELFGLAAALSVIAAEIVAAFIVTLAFRKLSVFLKALFCAVYPKLFLGSLFVANGLGENSLPLLVLIFSVAPITDVFAYFVGSLLKGPKLCPKISPKKTVSGAIGGLLGGVAVSCLVRVLFPFTGTANLPLFAALSVGAGASVLTELGDLFESAWKRKIGIKDSGKIFPGHGGMLDRVDGLMMASTFLTIFYALV